MNLQNKDKEIIKEAEKEYGEFININLVKKFDELYKKIVERYKNEKVGKIIESSCESPPSWDS